MSVDEAFRRQVIAALRDADPTPAMAYSDWLTEGNKGRYPEFFRQLGLIAAEVPDWVVSPEVAGSMMRSQELHDLIYARATIESSDWISDRRRSDWHTYGLPASVYGHRTHVFDIGVVPPTYTVVVDEQAKVFGLITECIQ